MKKLCTIALLSVSVLSFGLATPLSAGILDFLNVDFGIDGPIAANHEKHGTRISSRVDISPTSSIITKDNIRVSESIRGNAKSIVTKDDIRVEN